MIRVNKEICIGCENCVSHCLQDNIEMNEGKAQMVKEKCIYCGHCIALCPVDAIEIDHYDIDEVDKYNPEKFEINEENFLNFMKFRRSIRSYKNKEVEKEKIEKIIEAGRYSPTGGNRQHISYTIVKDKLPELREMAINKLYEISQDIKKGNDKGYNYNKSTLDRYYKAWEKMYEEFQEGEDRLFFKGDTLIIVKGDTRLKPTPQMELGIALSRMELMAYTLGLGTCYIGYFMTAFSKSKEIRDFLGIKDYEEVVSPLIIGYPDVKYIKTAPRNKVKVDWL
ncbi:MAG: nitroreductase family protein [Tissierellales bacterium]|jgi:nitroreductase/NAD-dependent dihydropyrimidine dehydrogenase PreA subunit|nr:nitroreductase family protein [Tissierellales bacterium]